MDVTQIPHLPDTPYIIPETHQQHVPETQLQQETQQETQHEIIQLPPNVSSYTKQCSNWWQKPLNDNKKDPKYEINLNDLYYKISQDERYYVQKLSRDPITHTHTHTHTHTNTNTHTHTHTHIHTHIYITPEKGR